MVGWTCFYLSEKDRIHWLRPSNLGLSAINIVKSISLNYCRWVSGCISNLQSSFFQLWCPPCIPLSISFIGWLMGEECYWCVWQTNKSLDSLKIANMIRRIACKNRQHFFQLGSIVPKVSNISVFRDAISIFEVLYLWQRAYTVRNEWQAKVQASAWLDLLCTNYGFETILPSCIQIRNKFIKCCILGLPHDPMKFIKSYSPKNVARKRVLFSEIYLLLGPEMLKEVQVWTTMRPIACLNVTTM